jgi:hypothetical protein
MDGSEKAEDGVDQSIIYVGLGAVMHQSNEIEKWDATTLGQLMRGMRNQTHWLEGLVDRLSEP